MALINLEKIKRIFVYSAEQQIRSTNIVEAPAKQFNKYQLNQLAMNSNADLNINEAEKIASVYKSIQLLANTVSKLNLKITDFDNNKIEDNTYKVLNFRPNSYTNRQTFYSTIITHMYLSGNAYCKINRTNTGDVANFQILPVNYFDKVTIKNNKLWYYSTDNDVIIRGEDLLHFKLISKDGIIGLNPIQSLRNELNINYKSQKTVNNLYSKNAQSTKILEFVGSSGNNQKIDEAIKKFEEQYAGVDNAGSVIVIPPNFKLNELKLSVADAEFLKSSELTSKQIEELFGITTAKYGSYEEENIAFIDKTISAILNIITTELEFKLFSDADMIMGKNIEFETDKLSGTTPNSKATYFKQLKDMGVLSPNQISKKLGYGEVENEYMNYHYQQMQYIPLEKWDESLDKLKGVTPSSDKNNSS